MDTINNVKRPNIKQYSRPFAMDNQFITVNRKQYAKDLEIYVDNLEAIMRLTAGNLRDVAITLPAHPKEAIAACHELADRLYNATIAK